MTFTNENGEKFELDELLTVTNPKDRIVIRPIEQKLDRDIRTVLNNYPREYVEDYLKDRPIKSEPKWKISEPKLFPSADKVSKDTYVMNLGLEVTEPQAQLIKEAVSELMEFVTNRNLDDVTINNNFDLMDAIDKARKGLQT